MVESLVLWPKITSFLNTTKIESENEYNQKMEEFERNVKQFYMVGEKCFLTKNNIGDDETFYMHVLRFYMLDVDKIHIQNIKLGLVCLQCRGLNTKIKNPKICFDH